MPAPHCQFRFHHAAFNVRGDRSLGPLEHRLIIAENAPQAADCRHISDGVCIINVVFIGCRQRSSDHLMHSHQQLARGIRAEHLLDNSINFRIAKSINISQTHLLLIKPLTQQPCSIPVIKNVPPGLQLHFKFRNR